MITSKLNIRVLSRYFLLSLFVLTYSCSNGQPKESGEFRQPDLVEPIKLDSTFHLDIKYATDNNFLGKPVYMQARAFLQRPAAEALIRANRKLQKEGYGIIIFDGYRPWSVTKLFWDSVTEEERQAGFVADPQKGSRHNRGCAVDLTLYSLETGKEVVMPSEYDEFTERAFSDFSGGDSEAIRLRDLLRSTMESEGFQVLKEEWWHFDYKDWRLYPILNLPFEEL
ncbi:MAG: M15 family metallopeptidase [Melioribacteraceae bacterium]|nr:M15 family metallopeptidase [Melioribacteraceae bacterium]